jgi:hypothetical protein
MRFYSRQGFQPTDRYRPLQLLGDRRAGNQTMRLLEMSRPLQP